MGNWGPGSFRIRGVEMFGEAFDYNLEEKRVACSRPPRILVENFRGNARVVGSDVSEVKVTGRKTVRAFNQADADSANQDSRLEVVNQGDLIVIRTNLDRSRGDRRVSADLEISVPKGATVEGRGRYGDFDISEVAGNVDITSDNAGGRVQNIGGNQHTDLRRSALERD